MSPFHFLFASILLSLLSCKLYARDEQCVVLGFSEFGNTRSCVENISLPPEQFKEVCERESDEYMRFETTYVAKCPPMYKAVCRGLRTQNGKPLPYVSYLYENDMSFMKKTCIRGGGTWEGGDG
ncbi:hypothetical protein [Teredinibacter turnerae]|uniref:hypothetical protein n=1 Tax=Teredinibacter turnerae TaxID=2426 RepID=UPI0004913E9C|nr:hypothetical protein [Teredinibacter turnerae]